MSNALVVAEVVGQPPKLRGEVRERKDVTLVEQESMYRLLDQHFLGVTRRQFLLDLKEKDWVVVLRDCDSVIRAFSTLEEIAFEHEGEPLIAYFSGDTIIDRDYWGSFELPKVLARHIFRTAATHAPRRAFWFLISSGYRTYRLLPLFFREFHPSWRMVIPPKTQAILNTLATHQFGSNYDSEHGIVYLSAPTPLKPGISDVTPAALHDPDSAFFLKLNPGYSKGDELACLAELTVENLTLAGRRFVGSELVRALSAKSFS